MSNIPRLKKIILLAGDFTLLLVSLPITLLLAFGDEFTLQLLREHIFPFVFLYFFILIIFYISGLYDIRKFRPATSLFPTIFIIHIAGAMLGITFFYLAADIPISPKTNLALNMIIGAMLIWFWRILFQRLLSGHLATNVAIAGINKHSEELAKIMTTRPYLGYKLSALIVDDHSKEKVNKFGQDVKILIADKFLTQNLQRANIETVITAENPHLNPTIAQAFYECIPHKIRFLDLSNSYEILTGRVPISYINQTWFLENINERQKKIYDGVKRFVDIISSSAILILSVPFWPIIAFLIKWESAGPVFYSQERVGANKKLFPLVKFRSMINNAEGENPIWAQKKDPRVTRVGSFLRKTHLDELPQMINIIKGDISLIGPRPERTEFVRGLEKQIPHYNIRHIIKPGFTGWAQVNFRYARTPMDTYEKFQYDLYYLKNRSLILDISILLKTVNLMFKKE